MLWVATPQLIVFDSQVSDFVRKGVEQGPETIRREGLHFAGGGQFLTNPLADSSCASPNSKSSLPAAESRSICSSRLLARGNGSSRANTGIIRSVASLVMAASIFRSSGPYIASLARPYDRRRLERSAPTRTGNSLRRCALRVCCARRLSRSSVVESGSRSVNSYASPVQIIYQDWVPRSVRPPPHQVAPDMQASKV